MDLPRGNCKNNLTFDQWKRQFLQEIQDELDYWRSQVLNDDRERTS